MSPEGHPRPDRAGNKSGHVFMLPKAEEYSVHSQLSDGEALHDGSRAEGFRALRTGGLVLHHMKSSYPRKRVSSTPQLLD
jgi:hypothetical protein